MEDFDYSMAFLPLEQPYEWDCATPLHNGQWIEARFLALFTRRDGEQLIVKQSHYVCSACRARLEREALT